jgi:hypothetical protein
VSISIEARYEVTWRSTVENWLFGGKYSKSELLKSQCQRKIKCGNPHEVKRNEVARLNMVQAEVEEVVYIFNLEYRLSLYQVGYHMDCQQSLKAQHILKTQVRWVKHNGLIHSTSYKTLEKPYVPVSKPEGQVWPVMAIFQILDIPVPKPDVLIFTD